MASELKPMAMILVQLPQIEPGALNCNSSRGECHGIDSHLIWCNIFQVALAAFPHGDVLRAPECIAAENLSVPLWQRKP
jgi:hypothetical protein